ncbi:hypothetical protein MVEN_00235700 [Mycena venus]|uniref:Uncharacterized protein n=1 Tax=Mycena venus TaxID=2733690 RepID=A0A8H7DF07_9AGAR|nr:hypothetical protein MVEN_00235700 [Mycena venus]
MFPPIAALCKYLLGDCSSNIRWPRVHKRRVDVARATNPPISLVHVHGSSMSNATTSIPSSSGCWGNSETAVSTCCALFGGIRIPIPDSSIAACGYNIGTKFTADNGSTSDANSTTERWSDCITLHFNATSDGPTVISTCQDAKSDIATVTSKPSPTATSGAVRRQDRPWRGILAGIVVGSGLLHLLSLAV